MQLPRRILVVDDDRGTRRMFTEFLEREGYEAVSCPGAAEALEILAKEHFDLLLADIRMAGMSGMELLERIREIPLEIGVIVMTAYGSKETAIRALRGRALNYLEKPFGLGQLREAVRQALPAQPQQVRWQGVRCYEGLTLDADAHRALVHGIEVDLTRIEFDLLVYLFGRLGCPVPMQELLEHVWANHESRARGPDSVKSCVRRLRRKIGDDAGQPHYIRNVRGVGYQLGGLD